MVRMPNDVEKRTDPDAARKERNRLNRKRGKQLETEISKAFLGNTRGKVSASGAGSDKGDVKIPLPHNSGNCYIECKTSALRNPRYGSGIPIRYEWFDIIERNRIAMGHRLGTLAIHFYNYSGNYIFFRYADIPILESISGNQIVCDGKILDYRYTKAGKALVTGTLYKQVLLDGFKESKGTYPNVRYETFVGPYIIVSVDDFKNMLGY